MTRRVVNILGFHRSGTSALAQQINALGFPLGFENQEQSVENPKGFFENAHVRSINDRALNRLNSAWFDWSLTPDRILEHRENLDFSDLRSEAANLLSNQFSSKNRLLIKDPRMMRMAWFWEPLFKATGAAVSNIIIIRSPAECAASQVVRASQNPDFYQSITRAEGVHALWCADHLLVLDYLKNAKCKAFTLMHRELMMDPGRTLDAIVTHLRIKPKPAELRAALDVIDNKLYRQRCGIVDGPWGEIAEEFFLSLQNRVSGRRLLTGSLEPSAEIVLDQLRRMQAVVAPVMDPMYALAKCARDRERAVTIALMKVRKPLAMAVSRYPVDRMNSIVPELERLADTTERRGMFLGVLATALMRQDRRPEARVVLEEIIASEGHNDWAQEQLSKLGNG